MQCQAQIRRQVPQKHNNLKDLLGSYLKGGIALSCQIIQQAIPIAHIDKLQ